MKYIMKYVDFTYEIDGLEATVHVLTGLDSYDRPEPTVTTVEVEFLSDELRGSGKDFAFVVPHPDRLTLERLHQEIAEWLGMAVQE